jgi:hypothetical protein
VNEEGVPYSGELVQQECRDYTLDVNPCSYAPDDTYGFTDENGYVEFSEKSFSLSIASRILRTIKSYSLIIAHGSVGTQVYLMSSGPFFDYEPGSGPAA